MFANNRIKLISKLILMEKFKNIVKIIDSEELTRLQIVSLIELLSNKIDINTISQMARKENKTPRGVRMSNQYRQG